MQTNVIAHDMVERSPSGLYTRVFYVLYYYGESLLQKTAARQACNDALQACLAAVFCKSSYV